MAVVVACTEVSVIVEARGLNYNIERLRDKQEYGVSDVLN